MDHILQTSFNLGLWSTHVIPERFVKYVKTFRYTNPRNPRIPYLNLIEGYIDLMKKEYYDFRRMYDTPSTDEEIENDFMKHFTREKSSIESACDGECIHCGVIFCGEPLHYISDSPCDCLSLEMAMNQFTQTNTSANL